jgi:bacterioferritin
MPDQKSSQGEQKISRDELANLLNEDLAREYQAIISYVVYSQVLKGAEYMSIADQLELHAHQELKHALIISRQVDYLGKMPSITPKPVRTSETAKEMLRFDLENENETIRNYRESADSDDCGQGFRLNAATRSDRRRPPVPTKAAGVWLPAW